MTDVLGYPRFVASWAATCGAIVTAALGASHGDVVAAIQLEAVFGATRLDDPTLGDDERAFLQQRVEWARDEGRLLAPAGHAAADAVVRAQRLAGRHARAEDLVEK